MMKHHFGAVFKGLVFLKNKMPLGDCEVILLFFCRTRSLEQEENSQKVPHDIRGSSFTFKPAHGHTRHVCV